MQKTLKDAMIKLYHNQRYQESFDIGNKLLKGDLEDNERKEIESFRDNNIEFIIDSYTKYPKDRINQIALKKEDNTENTKNTENGIIFTITTCKRLDLFTKTINSFITCCLDLDKIEKWICVDDNSSLEDREKMQKLYPFFEFIWKTPEQKGHVESMNIIFKEIQECNSQKSYKYWCHMEDDWLFFEKRNYLTECSSILEEIPEYGQVLFNVSFAQRKSCRNIAGGFLKNHCDIRCVEHEYYPPGKEYDDFIRRNTGKPTQGYWPHYSLRPSLLRIQTILEVGDFKNETGHFEMDYAKRYVKKGYKSCFLDTICSYHIGKLTWEKGDNSYSLNGVSQFVNSNNSNNTKKEETQQIQQKNTSNNTNTQKIQIKVIHEDNWLIVEDYDSFGNDIEHINTSDINVLKQAALLNDNCKGFNNLGYLKSTILHPTSWINVKDRFPNFKMYIKK